MRHSRLRELAVLCSVLCALCSSVGAQRVDVTLEARRRGRAGHRAVCSSSSPATTRASPGSRPAATAAASRSSPSTSTRSPPVPRRPSRPGRPRLPASTACKDVPAGHLLRPGRPQRLHQGHPEARQDDLGALGPVGRAEVEPLARQPGERGAAGHLGSRLERRCGSSCRRCSRRSSRHPIPAGSSA